MNYLKDYCWLLYAVAVVCAFEFGVSVISKSDFNDTRATAMLACIAFLEAREAKRKKIGGGT